MPRGVAAINALWRERQEAAARAREEAEELSASGSVPDEMPNVPEREPRARRNAAHSLLDLLPTLWSGQPGALPALPAQWSAPSAAQFPPMPSALPVQHMDSARYWGAAPIVSSASEQLPAAYFSPTPRAPNLDWLPINSRTAPLFMPPGHNRSAATPLSPLRREDETTKLNRWWAEATSQLPHDQPGYDLISVPRPAVQTPHELAWWAIKQVAPHLTSWEFLTTPPPPPSVEPNAAGKVRSLDYDPRVQGVVADLVNIALMAAPLPGMGPILRPLTSAMLDSIRAFSTRPRVLKQYEPFIRYETDSIAHSKVTPGGGLVKDTYAAPAEEGAQWLDWVNHMYNLPHKHLPRENYFHINAPPGTKLEGPRRVMGGFDDAHEVMFRKEIPPGHVAPGRKTPTR